MSTNGLAHLAEVVAELLRSNPAHVVLGEDVLDGGMLGLSRVAAQDEALRERLLPTPLVPGVAIAHAAGLALGGRRPILVLPSTTALLEGLAALREAAVMGWRTAQARRVPLVVVAPSGPGFSTGGDAADGVEGVLGALPGVRVLMAGRVEDLGAWLRVAASDAEDHGPTVLLLPRTLLASDLAEVPTHDLGRDAATPEEVRPGRAATVFAWGETVALAVAAAEHSGSDARVVDVGCLSPLPREALVEHARATGKIVIAHGPGASDRIAAELAALFADRAILHLDAPITRVGGTALPLAPHAERAALPSVERLADAIRDVARY